ncbi:MAG: hypothetical protein LC623_09055 [Halobacteriales archaeon]|nr:hypothetical protein [Halobacteriales archaeon]
MLRLPLFAILVLLGGCLQPQPPTAAAPAEPAADEQWAGVSLPDAQAKWGFGLQSVYEVVQGGNATLRHSFTDALHTDTTTWACGIISLGVSEGNGVQPLAGVSLSYTHGHLLILAKDSQPFVVNVTGTENPPMTFTQKVGADGTIKTGERLVFETAYLTASPGMPSSLAGSINITTDGRLRLESTVPFWFRCGSNLETFQGTFGALAVDGTVAVKDAIVEFSTDFPTLAEFVVVQVPWPTSTCMTFLLHNGTTVAESGRQTAVTGPVTGPIGPHCVLGYDAAPGRVGFEIKDSLLTRSYFAYTLKERTAIERFVTGTVYRDEDRLP